MSPVAMAFWRWLAALVLLLPFVGPSIAREWPLVRRSWKMLALLGVIGVGAFNTLTYTGLKYTTATNGVLLNSIIPVLVIAINVSFLREPLSTRQAGAVLSAIFLGESLLWYHYLGAVLIFAGLFTASRASAQRRAIR